MPETQSSSSHIADIEVPRASLGSSSAAKTKIVDFSDFEHQKENIQPLRRGRSASTLALLYGTTPAAAASADAKTELAGGQSNTPDSLASTARQSLQPVRPLGVRQQDSSAGQMEIRISGHLQTQNAQFQAEIAAIDPVETEDPLDVYYRYIQWLFEVFPQATGHQAIIKLVEKPLKLFKEQERYRNDARYVKMWIWYTGLITEGQDAVFQFLVASKIGDSLAILYEEYAKLLESMSKVRRADEIFQLGIARKAQPLARLERRYMDFQRRVMAQTMRDVELQQQQQQQQPSAGPVVAGGDDENGHNPHRTMLGNKRTGRSVRSAAANTLPSSQRGLPSQQQNTNAGASRPNSRISVFADPEGRASHAFPGAGTSKDPASSSVSNGSWLDIGSDEGRRKENMHEATSWRGQKLEQRRPLQSTGRPPTLAPHVPLIEKFTVFSDDGTDGTADAGQPSINTDSSGSQASVLGPKNAGETASTASSDLLHSFASADVKPKGSSKSQDKQKSKSKEKASTQKNPERMVMPDELLFPAGDAIPQCAEEARAKLRVYHFDYDAWCNRVKAERDEKERLRVAAEMEERSNNAQGLRNIGLGSGPNAQDDDDDDDDDDDEDIEDESEFPGGRRKRVDASSPTINTRAAQEGMLGIWNDLSDSDSDADSLLGIGAKHKAGKSKHSGCPSSAADDDYQFTMGPVTPNVVPEELSNQPAVIPSSARPSRFEAFLDRGVRGDKDENDPPTVVLNNMRSTKRQELQRSKTKATPLATRSQAPALSTASGLQQQAGRTLRDIDEDSEDSDAYDSHDLSAQLAAPVEPKTPLGTRMQIFRDPPAEEKASSRLQAPPSSVHPKPLFAAASSSTPAPLGRKFGVFNDQAPPTQSGSSRMDQTHPTACSSIKSNSVLHSTPARGLASQDSENAGFDCTNHSVTGTKCPQTPGFTTGYTSISGAELTGLSGFTGVSSIGGPTSSLDHAHSDPARLGDSDCGEDDLHMGEIAQTPMRKRLSMAAKDLRSITPRFPKTPIGDDQYQAFDEDDEDEDEDEDDEDEDDDDDPHTENIGEFADLDSQVNQLRMELGGKSFSVFRD